MAWIWADRVLDTSVTAGTGALVVSGTSPTGWRTFSTVCAVNDTFYYTIHDPVTGAWETGEGTYSALNTVTRTTLRSSSTGSAVAFAANAKNVFLDVIGYYFGTTIPATYAPLASPAFTGVPTAPTAATATNTTQVATTAYVQANLTAELSVPTGAVAYGDAVGTVGVTGVLADFNWDTTNKRLGVGVAAPLAAVHVRGVDQTVANYDPAGSQAATIYLHGTGSAVGTGGAVMFGDSFGPFGAIKGYATSGTGPVGDLVIALRRLGADATFTEAARWKPDGTLLNNASGYFGGPLNANTGTAIPAGGTLGVGLMVSTTGNFGFTFGSGAPNKAFARGSLYLNSTGTPYANRDGTSGNWGQLATITASVTPPTAPNDNEFWYNSDGSVGGGQLYIRFNDGNTTQWIPASPAASAGSTLLQTVLTETGALATGTVLIPGDDTIPQITEGFEVMTCGITPKVATSRVVVEVTVICSHSANGASVTAALFQDATANALAAAIMTQPTGTGLNTISFKKTVTPSGTTSLTTFRVRIGANIAGTVTFNGNSGARLYGGVMASSIRIQEVT